MLKVFGIKNCNSMKKAFDFLNNHKIKYEFVDFKKQQIDKLLLDKIIEIRGLDSIINTKGTTFKKLKHNGLNNTNELNTDMILQNLTLIKRPLIIEFADSNDIKNIYIGLKEMEGIVW